MQRRDVLTGVGTLLGTSVVAGCFGTSPTSPADDTTTTTPPTTQEPEPTVVDTVAVGDRDSVAFPDSTTPYVVLAVNRRSGEQDLTYTVTRDGAAVRDGSTTLDPADATELRLVEPADYTVELGVGDESTTIEVTDDQFDCNATTTTATIEAGGGIETRTISTTVACAGPDIKSSSIELVDSGCAGKDTGTATVSTDAGTIVVDGSITAPTPCYRVGLHTVELTGEGLRVVVEHAPPEGDGACIECVGALEYEATVTVENAYPDRVIVEHADGEDTTVVTSTDV